MSNVGNHTYSDRCRLLFSLGTCVSVCGNSDRFRSHLQRPRHPAKRIEARDTQPNGSKLLLQNEMTALRLAICAWKKWMPSRMKSCLAWTSHDMSENTRKSSTVLITVLVGLLLLLLFWGVGFRRWTFVVIYSLGQLFALVSLFSCWSLCTVPFTQQ